MENDQIAFEVFDCFAHITPNVKHLPQGKIATRKIYKFQIQLTHYASVAKYLI